ncbi:hypothetical protein [Arsenophonus sp. ENCA]|uniref:hypothetical protein n=1 Tax=Arsenophonus sp. ENCA TaxID=1987579 RepID=UPI0025BD6B31|nr:hypothetical protein [Arsenophonus sp. ENCA]
MDNRTKYEYPDFFLFLNLYFFFRDCETRVEHAIAGIKRLGCMTQILRNRRPFIDDTFLLLSAGLWNFHLRTA